MGIFDRRRSTPPALAVHVLPTADADTTVDPPVPAPGAGDHHPDYPEWEEGRSAPRLFQRLGGWSAGYLPPGDPTEPGTVMVARYRAHRVLWEAVSTWEREMGRLDAVAVALERQARERETLAAAAERADAAERERVQAEHQARAGRLEALAVTAESHLLRVNFDGDKVLLIADDRDHPALIARYPWEEKPPVWLVAGGVVVHRAGTTLESVGEFLDGWETLVATADAERRRADREHRQAVLDALRARVGEG
ncbi:hypothetical protein NYP18_03570 [Corynebacterium sp. YIM 101645]|uniref:Secreted protein n=1 Tax=Corynebacterium lemuris TaxID=1859292 RepID=A0ABT2FW75_9CORY|nr:hypothetical protein [Corynebacterium lemuris]MCS5478728.1 hypothetical protein [Corynebacterium lemuris]